MRREILSCVKFFSILSGFTLSLLATMPGTAYAARTMHIIGIDLTVSPNPIPCGGTATATATIKTAPDGGLPANLGATVTLWDHDTGLRDGDDSLDNEWTILLGTSGSTTVTFTLHCQTKEGGCDLYGPAGNSGESGTDVFVTVQGSDVESPHVYVNCYQPAVDATLGLSGADTAAIGSTFDVTMQAVDPIMNVRSATWSMHYQPNDLSVLLVTFLNPDLAARATYAVDPSLGLISFGLPDSPVPVNLEGNLLAVQFAVNPNPSIVWDTTYVRLQEGALFVNLAGLPIDVCLGGAHSIFIPPEDLSSPQINPALIRCYQSRVFGVQGAISDDLGPLQNYLSVQIYDESHELVAQDFVNQDGSFNLNRFFKLSTTMPSTLVVHNGVGLTNEYVFLPRSDFSFTGSSIYELLLVAP